jgi:hypothetical protein
MSGVRNEDMDKKKEYGWSEIEGDEARGPFDTKEDCIKDAKEYLNPDRDIVIEVGECYYADPVCYIKDDLDQTLEDMDEGAVENEFGFWEDEVFEVNEREKAQEELTEILTKWAKKYVSSSVWCLENTEKVTILFEK